MKDVMVYDIEIAKEVDTVPGKWSNPEGMGFASAVVYSYTKDHYYFFLHQDRMTDMLTLLDGKLVVGFNSIRFDSRVCLGNDRSFNFANRFTSFASYGWINYDIMFEYVCMQVKPLTQENVFSWLDNPMNHNKGVFSLNGLAGGTFNQEKSGHGAHAPILYQQQKYDELLEYNLRDVILTKKLFDHILTYSSVIDGDGRKQLMPKEV